MSRSMEIANLDTDYGRLLVSYVKALATTEACAADPSVVVALAADLADETERLLHHRFVQRETEFQVEQENRRLEAQVHAEANPVTWVPPEGETDRRGKTWFPDERDALRQAYLNGETAQQVTARHLRTPGSLASQLAGMGLLDFDGRAYCDVKTGDRWL